MYFLKLSSAVGGEGGSGSKNDNFIGESSKNCDEGKKDDEDGGVKESDIFESNSGVGEMNKDSDKVYIFYFIFVLFVYVWFLSVF